MQINLFAIQLDHIVTFFGAQVVKSPLKSSLGYRRFITGRNFLNEQALSAAVIYNDAVHTQRSTADSTENQTQRLYLR